MQARLKGKHVEDLVCVEIFCGTGRLTCEIRKLGLASSVGVDASIHSKVVAATLKIDLLKPGADELFDQFFVNPNVVYIHFAPQGHVAFNARADTTLLSPGVKRSPMAPLQAVSQLAPRRKTFNQQALSKRWRLAARSFWSLAASLDWRFKAARRCFKVSISWCRRALVTETNAHARGAARQSQFRVWKLLAVLGPQRWSSGDRY